MIMTSKELRQKYLDFFKSKKHAIIPSASLVPENDPTVLFTTAGMHPLVPYLLGEKHPEGKRLANVQKCIRTVDIGEVGDPFHHTFFEMMGNWSLGDYFKEEAIKWSWEFLTSPKWLNLNKKRLAVSVFVGDQDAPFDQEAFDTWEQLGVPKERIARLAKADNWWGPAGQTGPCGPDTEIFYWTDNTDEVPEKFDPQDGRWCEIWNDVFMQFNKRADGSYEQLEQRNVDTGMGLERILAVINNFDDNYQTELWVDIIKDIEGLSAKEYGKDKEITKAMRIVADHIKAAVFIIGDDRGIAPSNIGQGYVVRRLVRRAIRYGRQLGIKQDLWTKEIAKIVVGDYDDVYPELKRNKDFILKQLDAEEKKFTKTLAKGLRAFGKLVSGKIGGGTTYPDSSKINIQTFDVPEVTGKDLFYISATYGFPLEMCLEELGYVVNRLYLIKNPDFDLREIPFGKRLVSEFREELKKHQELSRTASAGQFKSGLADHSEETTKYHTTAHLLLAALRKVLGNDVVQKGSNITAERIRFDFSYPQKLTDEQKKKVEDLINQIIKDDLPVVCEEMPRDEAKRQGAMGVFESKYGEKVKVYTVGDCKIKKDAFSCEICTGPHVDRTGKLGHFKIIKEESSSAGVRRIKAVLE